MSLGLSTRSANLRLSSSLRILLQEDANRLRADSQKDTPEIIFRTLRAPHTFLPFICSSLFFVAFGLGVDTSGASKFLSGQVSPWSLAISGALLMIMACVNVFLVLRRAHRLRWEVHGRAVDVLLEFERACLLYDGDGTGGYSGPFSVASAALVSTLAGLQGGGCGAARHEQGARTVAGGKGLSAGRTNLASVGLSTDTWSREAPGRGAVSATDSGVGAVLVGGVVCGFNSAAWPALEFATAERDSKLTHELTHAVPVYRDGKWVRLPVALTVRGDIVALMNRESAPGAVRPIDVPGLGQRGISASFQRVGGNNGFRQQQSLFQQLPPSAPTSTTTSTTSNPGSSSAPKFLQSSNTSTRTGVVFSRGRSLGSIGGSSLGSSPSSATHSAQISAPSYPRSQSLPNTSTFVSARIRGRDVDALTLCADVRRYQLLETPAVGSLARRLRTLPKPQAMFLKELASLYTLNRYAAALLLLLAAIALIVRTGLTRSIPDVEINASGASKGYVGFLGGLLLQIPVLLLFLLPPTVPMLLFSLEALSSARLLAVHEAVVLRAKWKEWARRVVMDMVRAAKSEGRSEKTLKKEAAMGRTPLTGCAPGEVCAIHLGRLLQDCPCFHSGHFNGTGALGGRPNAPPLRCPYSMMGVEGGLQATKKGTTGSFTLVRDAMATLPTDAGNRYASSDDSDEEDSEAEEEDGSGDSGESEEVEEEELKMDAATKLRLEALKRRDANDTWLPAKRARTGLAALLRRLQRKKGVAGGGADISQSGAEGNNNTASAVKVLQYLRPDVAGVDSFGAYVPIQYAGHLNAVKGGWEWVHEYFFSFFSFGCSTSRRKGSPISSIPPIPPSDTLQKNPPIKISRSFVGPSFSHISGEAHMVPPLSRLLFYLRRFLTNSPNILSVYSNSTATHVNSNSNKNPTVFDNDKRITVSQNAWKNSLFRDDLEDIGFGLPPVSTPLLSSQLALRLGAITVFAAVDKGAVCDAEPTAEHMMILKGADSSIILDLHEDDAAPNGILIDQRQKRKHALPLKALGIACAIAAVDCSPMDAEAAIRKAHITSAREADKKLREAEATTFFHPEKTAVSKATAFMVKNEENDGKDKEGVDGKPGVNEVEEDVQDEEEGDVAEEEFELNDDDGSGVTISKSKVSQSSKSRRKTNKLIPAASKLLGTGVSSFNGSGWKGAYKSTQQKISSRHFTLAKAAPLQPERMEYSASGVGLPEANSHTTLSPRINDLQPSLEKSASVHPYEKTEEEAFQKGASGRRTRHRHHHVRPSRSYVKKWRAGNADLEEGEGGLLGIISSSEESGVESLSSSGSESSSSEGSVILEEKYDKEWSEASSDEEEEGGEGEEEEEEEEEDEEEGEEEDEEDWDDEDYGLDEEEGGEEEEEGDDVEGERDEEIEEEDDTLKMEEGGEGFEGQVEEEGFQIRKDTSSSVFGNNDGCGSSYGVSSVGVDRRKALKDIPESSETELDTSGDEIALKSSPLSRRKSVDGRPEATDSWGRRSRLEQHGYGGESSPNSRTASPKLGPSSTPVFGSRSAKRRQAQSKRKSDDHDDIESSDEGSPRVDERAAAGSDILSLDLDLDAPSLSLFTGAEEPRSPNNVNHSGKVIATASIFREDSLERPADEDEDHGVVRLGRGIDMKEDTSSPNKFSSLVGIPSKGQSKKISFNMRGVSNEGPSESASNEKALNVVETPTLEEDGGKVGGGSLMGGSPPNQSRSSLRGLNSSGSSINSSGGLGSSGAIESGGIRGGELVEDFGESGLGLASSVTGLTLIDMEAVLAGEGMLLSSEELGYLGSDAADGDMELVVNIPDYDEDMLYPSQHSNEQRMDASGRIEDINRQAVFSTASHSSSIIPRNSPARSSGGFWMKNNSSPLDGDGESNSDADVIHGFRYSSLKKKIDTSNLPSIESSSTGGGRQTAPPFLRSLTPLSPPSSLSHIEHSSLAGDLNHGSHAESAEVAEEHVQNVGKVSSVRLPYLSRGMRRRRQSGSSKTPFDLFQRLKQSSLEYIEQSKESSTSSRLNELPVDKGDTVAHPTETCTIFISDNTAPVSPTNSDSLPCGTSELSSPQLPLDSVSIDIHPTNPGDFDKVSCKASSTRPPQSGLIRSSHSVSNFSKVMSQGKHREKNSLGTAVRKSLLISTLLGEAEDDGVANVINDVWGRRGETVGRSGAQRSLSGKGLRASGYRGISSTLFTRPSTLGGKDSGAVGSIISSSGISDAEKNRVLAVQRLRIGLALFKREDDLCIARLAHAVKAIPPRRWLVPLARELDITQHDMGYFAHIKHVHTLVCKRSSALSPSNSSGIIPGHQLSQQGPPSQDFPQVPLPQPPLSAAARLLTVQSSSRLAPGRYKQGMQPVLSPAMTSTVVQDLRTGNLQMFTQGSLPFLLANCSSYWDGRRMLRLSRSRRLALLKTYLDWRDDDMDCIGLAYDPVDVRERDIFRILDTAWESKGSGWKADVSNNSIDSSRANNGGGFNGSSTGGTAGSGAFVGPVTASPASSAMINVHRSIGPADIGLGFNGRHVYLLARDMLLNATEDARRNMKDTQWLHAAYDTLGEEGSNGGDGTRKKGLTNEAPHPNPAPSFESSYTNGSEDKLPFSGNPLSSSSLLPSAPRPPTQPKLSDTSAPPREGDPRSNLNATTALLAMNLAQKCEANLLRMQSGQVFLGMIAAFYEPKPRTQALIRRLHSSGVRFNFCTPRNYRQARPLAQKMGLETGWNCAISLKIRKTASATSPLHTGGVGVTPSLVSVSASSSAFPQVPSTFPSSVAGLGTGDKKHEEGAGVDMGGEEEERIEDFGVEGVLSEEKRQRLRRAEVDEGLWDGKAKLPHGVLEIRKHLLHTDNVPLLVSLYTDSTPPTIASMLRLQQEFGEQPLVLVSALKRNSAALLSVGDVGVTVEPPEPSSPERFLELAYSSKTGMLLQGMGKVAEDAEEEEFDELRRRDGKPALSSPPLQTSTAASTSLPNLPSPSPLPILHPLLRFSSGLSSLHAGLSLPASSSLHVLLRTIQEARRILLSAKLSTSFVATAHAALSLCVLVNVATAAPSYLPPHHAIWFVFVIIPLLSSTILLTPAPHGPPGDYSPRRAENLAAAVNRKGILGALNRTAVSDLPPRRWTYTLGEESPVWDILAEGPSLKNSATGGLSGASGSAGGEIPGVVVGGGFLPAEGLIRYGPRYFDGTEILAGNIVDLSFSSSAAASTAAAASVSSGAPNASSSIPTLPGILVKSPPLSPLPPNAYRIIVAALCSLLPGALVHEYIFERALYIALGSPPLNFGGGESGDSRLFPIFLPPLEAPSTVELQGAVAWAQGITLFSLVLWLAGMSLHFLGRASTPWNRPSALFTHYWVCGASVAVIAQVAHSYAVAGGWGKADDSNIVWKNPFSPYLAPWDIWLTIFLWQLVSHLLLTVTKAIDVASHAQTMKRIKLNFDTRLGQWSPR